LKTQPQNCPLCDSPAEYYLVDYDNRKYFDCPVCKQFQISVRAEKILEESPQQWRDSFAQAAQQVPKGQAMFIRIPSPPQVVGDPKPKLTTEYVDRDKIPQ